MKRDLDVSLGGNDFLKEVEEAAGTALGTCYQCGKNDGTMDYRYPKLVRCDDVRVIVLDSSADDDGLCILCQP